MSTLGNGTLLETAERCLQKAAGKAVIAKLNGIGVVVGLYWRDDSSCNTGSNCKYIFRNGLRMKVLGVWYLGGQQLLLGIDLLLLSVCQILQLTQCHVQTRS